ncbi:MAG: hypothetical protein LUC48_11225 [Clostridiales bacterium]|nr:hypothetical protein [Clostridiales bacterium]
MDENTLFRGALHGFNREDVMEYITKITREQELALSEVENTLDEVRNELEQALSEQSKLQEQLEDVKRERDALQEAVDHKSDAELMLEEANAQIASLKDELAGASANQAAAEDALRAEMAQTVQKYQADAEGYNTLVDKAGRILLNAERAADATIAQANADAAAIRSEAQADADSLHASTRAQCDDMLAEAQTQILAAEDRKAAVQQQIAAMFSDSKLQYESMQATVGESISHSLTEVERLRSMLLNLNDTFNAASVAFDNLADEPAPVGE